MNGYDYPHSHQECPTCLMLIERAGRAEAAIVAALDESKATKILCLRIEELKAKLAEVHAAKTRAEESELRTAADLDEAKLEVERLTAALGGVAASSGVPDYVQRNVLAALRGGGK